MDSFPFGFFLAVTPFISGYHTENLVALARLVKGCDMAYGSPQETVSAVIYGNVGAVTLFICLAVMHKEPGRTISAFQAWLRSPERGG